MSVPPQYPSHFPARIAFIGDAPSSEDTEKGMPFVGSAGRIFNSMLRTANLDRAEFFISNVFDEKIPNNDIKNWCAPSKEAKEGGFDTIPPIGMAGYLRPEYHAQLDRLSRELDDVQPTVIVPLGPTALWAFTGRTDIGAQRGSVQPATRIAPGRKIVPTFHPGFVMAMWKFYTVVVADIIKAEKQSAYPDIRLPRREFLLEPTIQELLEVEPLLLNADLLSVDIETGWGQITNIGMGPSQNFAVNVPFVDLRKANKSFFDNPTDELAAWKYVKRVLESPVAKLGQNFGGYDAFWLLDTAGIAPRNFRHDTRLVHHALYPELPKDLEFMGGSYAEQGAWKFWARKGEKRDE